VLDLLWALTGFMKIVDGKRGECPRKEVRALDGLSFPLVSCRLIPFHSLECPSRHDSSSTVHGLPILQRLSDCPFRFLSSTVLLMALFTLFNINTLEYFFSQFFCLTYYNLQEPFRFCFAPFIDFLPDL